MPQVSTYPDRSLQKIVGIDASGQVGLAVPNTIQPDAYVNLLSERSTYDTQATGFSVLVIETSSIYYKLNDGSPAVWSDPLSVVSAVGGLVVDYNTKAEVEAATIAATYDFLRISGYTSAADGGGALYKRTGSEPAHAGKIQSNDGSWWEIAEHEIVAEMLGAIADDSTDNQTALQNAIDVAILKSGRLELGYGTYRHSGTLSISNVLTIEGRGSRVSVLKGSGGATQEHLNVSSEHAVHFHHFGIASTSTKTGGYGIRVYNASNNKDSCFENLIFSFHVSALDFGGATGWSVRHSKFEGASSSSGKAYITIANTNNPDAGDWEIADCDFVDGSGTVNGVNWYSSGGGRIISNKFLGVSQGVRLDISGTNSTVIALIASNSFDGCVDDAIYVRAGDTSIFKGVTITGNDIGGSPSHACVYAQRNGGSATLQKIVVTGNNITSNNSSYAIYLSDIIDFVISGNVAQGTNSINVPGTTSVGLVNGNYVGGGDVTVGANVTASNNL